MAFNASYTSNIIINTNIVPAAGATDSSLTFAYPTSAMNQGSGSTPACTIGGAGELAMEAVTLTIDLEAVPLGPQGSGLVGTGLKVQMLKLRSKTGNANPITIIQAVSNGYDGFGAAFSVVLAVAGAEIVLRTMDGGNNIGGTNRYLTVTGTLAQVLEVEIVFG